MKSKSHAFSSGHKNAQTSHSPFPFWRHVRFFAANLL